MPSLDNVDRPAPSVIFSTLASARRRVVLRELIKSGPSLTVTALSEKISDEHPDTDARRIFAQLHHSHLPKLEDSGMVTVEDDLVTLGNCIEVIEPYLVLAERYESMREK
ncbi:MAG: ArsR family transcriptional regulator [Haladaptatus sp.]